MLELCKSSQGGTVGTRQRPKARGTQVRVCIGTRLKPGRQLETPLMQKSERRARRDIIGRHWLALTADVRARTRQLRALPAGSGERAERAVHSRQQAVGSRQQGRRQ